MVINTQVELLSPNINLNRCGGGLTVNYIFEHNHNWDRYLFWHKDVREVEKREVERMLSCRDKGCFLWHCPKCNEFHIQSFGCNSRLCSSCGKRYTDAWAERVAKSMFNVTHRHIVMTIPDRLWPLVKEHRFLQKVLMDSAIIALNDTLSYLLRKDVKMLGLLLCCIHLAAI